MTTTGLGSAVRSGETELERAEKRYEQAKARLQGLRNREATRLRKLDTRRKVILGGALLDLAERDDGAAAMVDRLMRNLPRDQDRKAFEGWDAPRPSRATGGDVASGDPAGQARAPSPAPSTPPGAPASSS